MRFCGAKNVFIAAAAAVTVAGCDLEKPYHPWCFRSAHSRLADSVMLDVMAKDHFDGWHTQYTGSFKDNMAKHCCGIGWRYEPWAANLHWEDGEIYGGTATVTEYFYIKTDGHMIPAKISDLPNLNAKKWVTRHEYSFDACGNKISELSGSISS